MPSQTHTHIQLNVYFVVVGNNSKSFRLFMDTQSRQGNGMQWMGCKYEIQSKNKTFHTGILFTLHTQYGMHLQPSKTIYQKKKIKGKTKIKQNRIA